LKLAGLVAIFHLAYLPIAVSAGQNFLTLPFMDPNVIIQQGWIYTTDGPFDCQPGGTRCHKGIDYVKGALDQVASWQSFDVAAAADGWAISSISLEKERGYGRFVYIAHDVVDGSGLRIFTLYAHLKTDTIRVAQKSLSELRTDVAAGDFSTWSRVSRGTVIGEAGDTGEPGVIHLHFEVQRGGYPLNKTDPYDINNTREFYPVPCGPAFLWTQCPPVLAGGGDLRPVLIATIRVGVNPFGVGVNPSTNEEGFFVSSRDSAMREKGALNEAARRRPPGPPTMGIDGSS
jgi:hypothetical protein